MTHLMPGPDVGTVRFVAPLLVAATLLALAAAFLGSLNMRWKAAALARTALASALAALVLLAAIFAIAVALAYWRSALGTAGIIAAAVLALTWRRRTPAPQPAPETDYDPDPDPDDPADADADALNFR